MHKKIYTLLFAAAALLFGCQEEYVPGGNTPRDVANGVVRFMIPRGGASVTYPTRAEVTGDPEEYKIADLMIYQFDANADVYEDAFIVNADSADHRLGGASNLLGNSQTDRAFTISMGAEAAGVKHFYMVANLGKNATDSVMGNTKLIPQVTTSADFEAALQTIGNGYLLPNDSLPMFSTVQTKLYVAVDLSALDKSGYEVKMKRAIARIDIANDATTKFTVKQVIVRGLNTKGNVFPKATVYKGNAADAAAYTINDATRIGDINTGKYKSKALLYILPTQLNTTATQIYLDGTFNGGNMTLPVSIPDTVKTDNITANNIYCIKVQQLTDKDVTATLTVADWDDGGSLPTQPNIAISVSPFYDVTGGKHTKLDSLGYVNVTPNTSENTKITFVAKSESQTARPFFEGLGKSIAAGAKLVGGTPQYVATPTPHYEITYQLELPYLCSPIENDTLVIRSMKAEKKILARFVIKSYLTPYDKTNVSPVMIGGIWWAPVNVGAKTLPDPSQMGKAAMNLDMGGYVYQWGRTNAPFDPANKPTTAAGPVTVEVANANPTVFYASNGGWCTTNDATWGGKNNVQGPCPDGWRMPTKDEVGKIPTPTVMNSGGTPASPTWTVVTGDDKKSKLYFCWRGYIDINGIPQNIGNQTNMWTTTADPSKPGFAWQGFYNASHQTQMIINSIPCAFALPVRCVHDPL